LNWTLFMRSFHLVPLASTHTLAKILRRCRESRGPRALTCSVGPAQADLCRDFFCRAIGLELSFFEAAYTTSVSPADLGTAQPE
jgi:hypothetical protein